MCLAQEHSAVAPVRLEPATPRSRVKHSTSTLPTKHQPRLQQRINNNSHLRGKAQNIYSNTCAFYQEQYLSQLMSHVNSEGSGEPECLIRAQSELPRTILGDWPHSIAVHDCICDKCQILMSCQLLLLCRKKNFCFFDDLRPG